MNKRITCILSVLIITSMSLLFAQNAESSFNWPERSKGIGDFVPKGHFILGRAEADLNGDTRQDLVLVLQKKGGGEQIEGTPRWLVILFKQADGSYLLSLKSSKALPTCGSGVRSDVECGGPWVVNNTFKIRDGFSDGHHGVTTDYQFLFQNDGWYVIGRRSEHLGDDVGSPQIKMDEEILWSSRLVDNNYLTGTRIETWSCGSCEDPEIELTLKYHDGEYAETLQEYFEKGESGEDSLAGKKDEK